jgi:hypothetical protein
VAFALAAGTAIAAPQLHPLSWAGTRWRSTAGDGPCRMVQEIPGYGRAVFQPDAAGRLSFYIEVMEPPARAGEATLASKPSPWRSDASGRPLGGVLVQPAARMEFGRTRALRVLYELEQGLFVTLEYADWSDGWDRGRVEVSPIAVREAYAELSECRAAVASAR